jgi:MoaA/NifB/PqqE/SkfB family radical SAM enzyme
MRWTKHAETFKRFPSWIYKLGTQLWIDYSFPRHIFIELTSDCNLSCSYCPRPKISREIPYELFKKVVDEASLYGPRSFSLHLFGEPMLYSRFIDAVRYIKSRGNTLLLTTNGTLLRRYYRDLREVDKIILSYKEGVKVPEELKTWKNFTVRFFGKEDKSWPRREVKKLHNYGGTQKSIVRFTASSRFPCYHPFLAPAVTSSGNIVICCNDPNEKSVIGNVRDMTIAEAWRRMTLNRDCELKGIHRGICHNCNTWSVYPSCFFSWQYTM